MLKIMRNKMYLAVKTIRVYFIDDIEIVLNILLRPNAMVEAMDLNDKGFSVVFGLSTQCCNVIHKLFYNMSTHMGKLAK